ncbi:MAG: hypothetical protein ACRC0X_08890 [Brevinema sp.]
MKYFLWILLITIPTFAQNTLSTELLNLQQNFKKHLYQPNTREPLITIPLPDKTIQLTDDYEFIIPPLDLLNPSTTQFIENKQYLIETDLVKLSVSLFMITNIKQLKDSEKFYTKLFKKSETRLLSLAKQALKADSDKAKLFSMEYNLLIQSLSAVPFPPEYSFYRRRMAYSLETSEAAQQEIDRLNERLKNLP